MNWEAVGAIGEILGALVVAITIVYLAIQTRLNQRATEENIRLTRAQAKQMSTESPRENRRAFSLSQAAMADSPILS